MIVDLNASFTEYNNTNMAVVSVEEVIVILSEYNCIDKENCVYFDPTGRVQFHYDPIAKVYSFITLIHHALLSLCTSLLSIRLLTV